MNSRLESIIIIGISDTNSSYFRNKTINAWMIQIVLLLVRISMCWKINRSGKNLCCADVKNLVYYYTVQYNNSTTNNVVNSDNVHHNNKLTTGMTTNRYDN